MLIILRTLGLAALLAACLLAVEPGFVSLFDGKTLDGWSFIGKRGSAYFVEDGKIVCPADSNGNLHTVKRYANFILRLEYFLPADGNNGIAIRAPGKGEGGGAMEIQIIDDNGPKYTYPRRNPPLRPEQLNGAIYDVWPARSGYGKINDWSAMEILADGPRIRVTLNGVIVLDANLDDVQEAEVLNKHAGLKRASGHVGFLGHTSRVEFRNIRIKELP